jgi:hypothetical protein
MATTERQFPCTPGGAILQGRRRLRNLLLGLTALMLVVGGLTLTAGRTGPGLLALAVAMIPWTAWRMSGDLDPFWLEVGGGKLTVQMRRRRERFAAAGAEARPLTPEEVAHLETLTSSGGVSAGTGGFESHRLGEFDLYASNLGNAVLVDLGETRLIVTPDDPAAFLAALRGP